MALIKCKECGKEISDTAKKCPYCGFKEKGSKKFIIVVISIILLLVVIAGSIAFIFIDNNNNIEKEEIILTYEEQMAVNCLNDYKYKLKNPNSLQVFDIRWRDMSAVNDGDMAIYFDVTGENSFGGSTRNVILYGIQSGEVIYGGSSDDWDSDDYIEQISAQIIQEDYPSLLQDDNAKISVERVMSAINN